MMVVDCSVTMPWLLKNDASGYSEKTLDALLTGSAIVPALWHLEVQNVLLMFERRKRILRSESERFCRLLADLPITTDDTPERVSTGTAVALARECGLTLYDAVYLGLAMRTRLPFATLDKALRKAARRANVELWNG